MLLLFKNHLYNFGGYNAPLSPGDNVCLGGSDVSLGGVGDGGKQGVMVVPSWGRINASYGNLVSFYLPPLPSLNQVNVELHPVRVHALCGSIVPGHLVIFHDSRQGVKELGRAGNNRITIPV